MMVIMMHSTSANPDDLPKNDEEKIMYEDHEIMNSTCQISWKLYHNPFFAPTNKLKPKQLQRKYSASAKYIHHQIHSDLNMNHVSSNNKSSGQIQIAELKAELERERKMRKKVESLNKKLSKELADQVEKDKMCVCEDLGKEIARLKEEMEKMKKEMEEERKMLRMAEVLREERVQMKLADAQLFYHHQFLNQFLLQHQKQQQQQQHSGGESKRLLPSTGTSTGSSSSGSSSFTGSKNGNALQRKASPEPENPHIKQGIKGFVEFQRAIRVKNGSNSNYNSGGSNKVECQKAQLRVLFKNKCPLPFSYHNHLILS